MDKPYKVRYLPAFYDDLESAVLYISNTLRNSKAANKLIDSVEKAIIDRLPMADKFEKYHSARERKYPYYRIYVGNYVVYYVVIETEYEKIMEVRRLLHSLQNRDKIL